MYSLSRKPVGFERLHQYAHQTTSNTVEERKFLPFAAPDITAAELEAVAATLREGWLTTGPRAHAFQRRFAAAVGAPHGVVVNSCTAALHLALEAMGISAGDEVIVPTMTFAATAEVVRYLGAVPILADVRPDDHNIDVEEIERRLTPRTRAVIPVHFAGQPCEMDEIRTVASARGLKIVWDAAHCFPASYRGRNIGEMNDISCFSFYATKTITTGEGGAAVTGDAEWADRMRLMSLHGISRSAWNRYSERGSWYYEIEAPGYKYNLTDVAAALGLVQLDRADGMRARRAQIAARYSEALDECKTLELPVSKTDRTHAFHLYVVKLRHGVRMSRDEFIDGMKARGIGTSVHFIPLHMHPYYRDCFGYRPGDLPVSRDLYERSVSLPIYSAMSDGDIERVVEAVLDVLRGR